MRLKKTLLDLVFAVLKAGITWKVRVTQLTHGNNKSNAGTPQGLSPPCGDTLSRPPRAGRFSPSRAGQVLCLKMALLH